jgi:hypothetical protein
MRTPSGLAGRVWLFVKKYPARLLGVTIFLGLIYSSLTMPPNEKSLDSFILPSDSEGGCAGKPVDIESIQRLAADSNYTESNKSHWSNGVYYRWGKSGWWRLELGITEDKFWRLYLMRNYCIVSATGPGRIEDLR